MKFIIEEGTQKVEYKDLDFWKQFDELEVEEPENWYVKYMKGGVVHTFDYCQSTGRGEYVDAYVESPVEEPLNFTADTKKNAEIMQNLSVPADCVLIKK